MMSVEFYLMSFCDSLAGHLMWAAYFIAIAGGPPVREWLKKLPPLLLVSPLLASTLAMGLYAINPGGSILRYCISSAAILAMCTRWAAWAWRQEVWKAFSAACLASILQVAASALVQVLFLFLPSTAGAMLLAMAAVLLFSVAVAVPLRRSKFGVWFRLLLEDRAGLRRTAGLLLALEVAMEAFMLLQNGLQTQYFAMYYLLLVVLVLLIAGLIVYLALRFDDSRTLRNQQDVIAQQQLYEQSLEDIRREARAFRHDYKNLLAGLSQQVEEGELQALRATLSELDVGFDRRLGEKIQRSVQIGNLRLPEVRSLLLNKLAVLREKRVPYRLEVLYPVETVGMSVWDYVRCLGILLDNAMEAALEVKEPWVEVVLLSQGGRLFLRVANPYQNAVDPGKLWDDGWSTKGAGRGVGLSSYQRILGEHPNASACTSWEGGVFVQELTVEDRA